MSKPPVLSSETHENALDQLNLVLSFFPRVDAMLSLVLSVDLAMLGVLAANMPRFGQLTWLAAIAVLPVILIATSLYNLYSGAFPRLDGGQESLVYFAEIAKKTEANFIFQFEGLSGAQYARDVLGQVWRNSQILTAKYRGLRLAFVFLSIAILPWVIALAVFSTIMKGNPA